MRPNKLQLAMWATGFAASSLALPAAAAAIEEVVITGGRLEESIPQDLARYGNQLEIITAEQLQRGGFIDVAQSLQMLVPGLHLRPKNGQFDYFDASLQGSRNTEILWLIDGVRITNRLYNGTSPLDTVPAHMIERIEILKGGQGIFYGTQSVGGVVNIVTRSLQQGTDGAVGIGANTNDGYNVNGYFRAGNEELQFLAYGSRDEADGYLPYRSSDLQPSATDRERGYEVNVAGLKLGFRPTEGSELSLHYQRSENELDFLRAYLNYNSVNAREEDIFTLKYELQVNDALGLYVKAYRHDWDTRYTEIFNTLDANGQVTGALRYRNNGDYWGYRDDGYNAMLKYTSPLGVEFLGGFDRQEFSGYDDVWRIGELEEAVNAWFGQVRTAEPLFGKTMLALGLRRNNPSSSASKTVWNLSGRHDLLDNLYVQANIGTSFRLPDAEQLFLNELYDADNDGVPDDGWFAIGNPDLKPEQSRNINISLGGQAGLLSYEITAFHRDITDYIASYVPINIAGVEGESFINTDDEVNIHGFEIQAGLQLGKSWHTSFSYTDTTARLNDGGPQLPGIPESEVKLQLAYNEAALPWGATLSLNHVGDFNARPGQPRGNYTVLDLSGYYEFGARAEHRIVLRVENLSDKVYATRVDSGTRDSGGSYLYDNLGMERTLHASYSYAF